LNFFAAFADELVNRWHVLDARRVFEIFPSLHFVGAAAKPSQRFKPQAGAISEVKHRRPPERMTARTFRTCSLFAASAQPQL
jgi:hypothetical protein